MIISKMYCPLAEDHATLGCDVLMAEYLFNLGVILIFYICQRSVHSEAKQTVFVLPFLLAAL